MHIGLNLFLSHSRFRIALLYNVVPRGITVSMCWEFWLSIRSIPNQLKGTAFITSLLHSAKPMSVAEPARSNDPIDGALAKQFATSSIAWKGGFVFLEFSGLCCQFEPRQIQTYQTWVNLHQRTGASTKLDWFTLPPWMEVIFDHHIFWVSQTVNQPRQVSCPGYFIVCCSWALNWQSLWRGPMSKMSYRGWMDTSFHCSHASLQTCRKIWSVCL